MVGMEVTARLMRPGAPVLELLRRVMDDLVDVWLGIEKRRRQLQMVKAELNSLSRPLGENGNAFFRLSRVSSDADQAL